MAASHPVTAGARETAHNLLPPGSRVVIKQKMHDLNIITRNP